MELNIVTFGYLFLRLAPFILVCFFSLASIFNQDYKGLIYLIGLLFACVSTGGIGKLFKQFIIDTQPVPNPEICNMITIGQSQNVSDLPLGQTVFSYTFVYLLYAIVKHKYVSQNIATIVFFPVLIVADFMWNIKNSCNGFFALLMSSILGGIFGLIWAAIIDSTNAANLQYFSIINNKEVCSKPSASTFRCNVFKNGKLIGGNISGPSK
jgi:hypothetical protein